MLTVLLPLRHRACRYRDELQRRKEKNFFVDLKRVHEMDSLTEQFQPLAESRACQQKVTADDYVGIISDALTLDKNVGVVRNFGRLLARMAYAKAASKSGDSQWFIDVWPIVPHAGRSRYTYELLLQLATIVKMAHTIEKYTKMRINSVVSTSNEIEFEFKRISDLVHDLRIEATVKVIALDLQPAEIGTAGFQIDAPIGDRHRAYNSLMKIHSDHSCVLFTYLPSPPPSIMGGGQDSWPPSSAGCRDSESYIKCLDTLSLDLPPIIMMQGVEEVVTKDHEAV